MQEYKTPTTLAELTRQKEALKGRIREREEKFFSFWEGLPGIALSSGLAIAGGFVAGKLFSKKKESHQPSPYQSAVGGGGNPLRQILLDFSLMGVTLLLDRLFEKRHTAPESPKAAPTEPEPSAA
jgi:hypothetical protein